MAELRGELPDLGIWREGSRNHLSPARCAGGMLSMSVRVCNVKHAEGTEDKKLCTESNAQCNLVFLDTFREADTQLPQTVKA
jgi:hypothetical protein